MRLTKIKGGNRIRKGEIGDSEFFGFGRHRKNGSKMIDSPNKVAFVTEPWGIGKARLLRIDLFIDPAIAKRFGDSANLHYYSLSGKDSVETIDRETYRIFHPKKSCIAIFLIKPVFPSLAKRLF